MEMIVLAGGFGTRLKTVVSDVPKPLAPIEGLPFLHYQMNNWISQGVDSFIFLLHFQSNLIIDFLKEYKGSSDLSIRWLIEDEPLGTGGAISNAVSHFNIQTNFLMTNADTWLGEGCLSLFDKTKSSLGVINVEDSSRYGSVLRRGSLICGFHEKTFQSGPGWINAGLSCFSPKHFSDWDKQPYSLEELVLPKLAREGVLHAVELDTEFIDIGIPEDYYKFCDLIKNKKSNQ